MPPVVTRAFGDCRYPRYRRYAAAVALLLAACTGDRSPDRVQNSAFQRDSTESATHTTLAQTSIDSLLAAGDSIYSAEADSAAVLWASAYAMANDIGDSARMALALTGRGQAAMHLGQPSEARRWGETALAMKRRLGMRTQLFRSLNALGLLAWREDRFADALSLYSEAVAAARAVGDSAGVVKANMNQGLVLKDQGLYVEARQRFVDAAKQFAVLGDRRNLARTLNNQASLETALGQPQTALALLTDARQLAAATRDSILELNARGQLAVALAALGAPQRAFALIDSANAMARAMGALPEEAENLRVLGDLYLDAGDARHALDSYRAAAARHATLEQPAERASLLRQQAHALRLEGNLDAAERLTREALAAHTRVGAPELAYEDLLLLVELAQQRGRTRDAERWLKQLSATSRTLASPMVRGQYLLALAREYARRAQWGAVAGIVRDSTVLDSLVGADEQAERHLLLARAYAARRELPLAVEEARQAVALVDQIRAQYATGELRARYTDTRARVYAELTLALLRQGNVAEAFSVADAARGRSLVELLERTATGTDGQRAQAEAENLLLRRIDALVRQLRVREAVPARDRSSALGAASNVLRDSLRVLRGNYEAIRARREAVETRRAAAVPLRELQLRLEPNELLLEYLATPDGLVIFAVTRHGAYSTTVPVRPESLAMRISLARALIQPQHAATASRALLEALHADLVVPALANVPREVLSRIRGTDNARLIIVPHGLLAAVPYAALLDTRTGRHLVEEWSVLLTPSATTLSALRATPAGRPPTRLHAFAPLTGRLRASRAEALSAAQQIRDAGSRTFVDGAATEAQLRTTVNEPVAVHVASHAVVNGHNPLFSRIELQPGSGHDGRLEVHELLTLRVRTPLVFLSGCETAVGNVRATRFETRDEFTSMARAWLIAGARSVVATLWRIDDSAAATLATRFYEALHRSAPPEALAEAQRAMLRDTRLRHPYFWAAYQVVGTHR